MSIVINVDGTVEQLHYGDYKIMPVYDTKEGNSRSTRTGNWTLWFRNKYVASAINAELLKQEIILHALTWTEE